jgi:hypothetical protein
VRSKFGIVPLVGVLAVWLVFVVLLIASPLTLAEVWLWIGDLPVAARGLVTLVFLPWVLALAAWFSQLDDWLRIAAVAGLAVVSIVAFLPRRSPSPAAEELAAGSGAGQSTDPAAEVPPPATHGDASLAGPGAVPRPLDHPVDTGRGPDVPPGEPDGADDRRDPGTTGL